MNDAKTPGQVIIRTGNRLGRTLEQLQQKIRERAYQIFLDRDRDEGDSIDDWMLAQSEILPPIELKLTEQKKNIVVEADLKGFSPKEIEVELRGDVLSILGSHSTSSSHNKAGAHQWTSKSSYFYQSLTLPVEVTLKGSKGQLFKNGKLKVTLPKK